jgi:L-lactate dehydrogenase complex protein LldG
MVGGAVMSGSRDEILNRVRNALQDVSDEELTNKTVDRNYRVKSDMTAGELLELFAENVGDYRATVKVVHISELQNTIRESCKDENVRKLVIPPGLDQAWIQWDDGETEFIQDGPEPFSHNELDTSDAVLTGCFMAVAQTGTIVLNGGAGQGRRALTLLPDLHICVVDSKQIVGIVPEVFRTLESLIKTSSPPVTLISGPSATSDIELSRVEGVHGPRRLHVIIADNT